MQIYDKRLDEIKPYENNPRHNDNAVDAVANSIREFGFKVPIVVDSEGVIVAGHTRYKAAKKLGLQTVPCLVADDLNEEQINAFRLADNKVGELATWDLDTLKVELDNIGEIDMSEFGFSLDGIGEEPQEVQEDDFDEEPPEEPISKLGDIYQLGEHRLMCGDSTNAEHVAKLMDGAKADMVFTDPPYGVSYEGGLNEKKKKQIKNDCLTGQALYQMLYGAFSNIKLNTINKAGIYIFYAHSSSREFLNALYDVGLKQRSILIWHKTSGGFGDFMAQYMNAYEPCIYASNGDSVNWYGATNEKTVWDMDKEKVCNLHPTMKPIAVVSRAIKNSSQKNNKVLDLFGGSGSTLIACEQLNRKCFMMELDPKYVDVIIKRWEEYTGKKAVKIA